MKSSQSIRFAFASLAALSPCAFGLTQTTADVKQEPLPRTAFDVKSAGPLLPTKEYSEAQTQRPLEGDCALKPVGESSEFRPPSLVGRVLFDEPGDGTLWARGGNHYKASFDEEGATYVPNFGPHAPRNYPVRFTLKEVLIDGQPISFDSTARCSRTGHIVSYDRGSLTEVYDLGAESMEQLFLLDSIPASGDLLVRMSVDTELEFSSYQGGFRFHNELGSVGFGRATVLDGAASSQLIESKYEHGEIEIRVPASFLASATLPVTIDPVISTFDVDVDNSVHAHNPDVAYDQTTDRYTVVWEEVWSGTDRDAYSALMDSQGVLIPNSEATIDFTSDCWANPSVANNQIANNFLIAAQTSSACASDWIIEGRTREAGSNSTGTQFVISGAFAGDKLRPDVGGDPNPVGPTYFCVVWEREWLLSDGDIHYQMVRADGTLLNASTELIVNNTENQRRPSVSKSDGQTPFTTQEWNVVWDQEFAGNDRDIYGAQVHWDGILTTPSFLIDFSSADDTLAQASSLLNVESSDGDRDYLVVYERRIGSDRDVAGIICGGGTAKSNSTNLSALDSPHAATRLQIQPAVETDGECFALVYSEQFSTSLSDYDIYASTLTWDGIAISVPEAHESMATSVDGEYRPMITSTQSGSWGTPIDQNRFMAVWTDRVDPFGSSAGNGDIEGALYDANPTGCYISHPTCPTSANSTGNPAQIMLMSSCDVASQDTLTATNVPNQPGLFYHGPSTTVIPFGCGNRCITGFVVRHPVVNPSGGTVQESFFPAGDYGILSGSSVVFQFWHRDPLGCGSSGFNLSNSVRVEYH